MLLHSSRDYPEASVKSMKGKIGTALNALERYCFIVYISLLSCLEHLHIYIYIYICIYNKQEAMMTIYIQRKPIMTKYQAVVAANNLKWYPLTKGNKTLPHSYHAGDKLLKIRFKLGQTARNLPMLEKIYQPPDKKH